MNCPVHQLEHFVGATDDPQTIQKQNYVLQLYDETETYNILYHKFSSMELCTIPDVCSQYFQQLKYKGEINFKKVIN